MFLNFIWKMSGPNLSRKTDYPEFLFSKYRLLERYVKLRCDLSYTSFQFVIPSSLRHPSFCELKTYTLEKATKAQRGSRRIALLFVLTWALGGNGNERHAPAALPRERDPVPIVKKAVWAPEPVLTGAEIPSSLGFDPRTIQPVGCRCTD
jgi:hypothetical protein